MKNYRENYIFVEFVWNKLFEDVMEKIYIHIYTNNDWVEDTNGFQDHN